MLLQILSFAYNGYHQRIWARGIDAHNCNINIQIHKKAAKDIASDDLQMPDSAMVDVAGGVVVKLVSSIFAFSRQLELILVSPVKHLAGARFVLGHPWDDHGSALKITLGYMYLQEQEKIYIFFL